MAIGISSNVAQAALMGQKPEEDLSVIPSQEQFAQDLNMMGATPMPVQQPVQTNTISQGTVLQQPDNREIINQVMSQAGVPQLDKQIIGAIQEDQRLATFNQSVDAARDAYNATLPVEQRSLEELQQLSPVITKPNLVTGSPASIYRALGTDAPSVQEMQILAEDQRENPIDVRAAQTSPAVEEYRSLPAVTPTPEKQPFQNMRTVDPGDAQAAAKLLELPEGVQPGSPQAAFLEMQRRDLLTDQEIKKGELLAERMGTTFSPETGFSRDPFLQAQEQQAQADASRQASLLGRPMEGQTLSQFMRYEDQPIQRTEQFVDPGTGRIRRKATEAAVELMRQDGLDIPQGVQPLAPEYSPFERESLMREVRLAQKPDFMEAQPVESRAGDRYSSSDLRDIFGGGDALSQAKALQRAGIDPVTKKRMTSEGAGEIFQVGGKLLVRDPDGKTRSLGDVSDGLSASEQIALQRFKFDVSKFNYEQQKDKLEAEELEAASKASSIFKVKDLLRQNELITRAVDQAGENIGFGKTGASGALFSLIPGTKAFDQKSVIETLEADAAFGALQALRDASKTGGALGSVSERELALLSASRGSLRQGQTADRFRENLENYIKTRNQMMLNVYDGFTQEYGSTAANEAFGVTGRDQLIAPQAGEQQPAGGVDTLSDGVEIKITGRNN